MSDALAALTKLVKVVMAYRPDQKKTKPTRAQKLIKKRKGTRGESKYVTD